MIGEKKSTDSLSKTITTASWILAVAITLGAWQIKPFNGRYTFTPNHGNWVIIGDSRTARSWLCAPREVYEDYLREKQKSYSQLPQDFNGCAEIMVPKTGFVRSKK